MEEKVFTIEFTFEELDTVLRGLQEMPFRKVTSLVNKIVKSYEEQSAPKEEVKKK